MLSDDDIHGVCEAIELRFGELSGAEAAADERPPDILYHYTSAEGFLGIVRSGELWATNALYLNDASELSHATGILEAELKSVPLGLLSYSAAFPMGVQRYLTGIRLDHFIVSFCEDRDLLSQWRGYGGAPGAGYSIGFSTSALQAAAARSGSSPPEVCTLRRAKYCLSQKREMIRARIAALNEILNPVAGELEPARDGDSLNLLRYQIAASFHPTLALMKHCAFEAESEWRLVRTLSKPLFLTADWPVKFRVVRGRLAPYLSIPWVLQNNPSRPEVRGIREVCCGPSIDPEPTEVVRDLLTAWKCSGTQVLRSEAPLRA
jgi:hypothetical protein